MWVEMFLLFGFLNSLYALYVHVKLKNSSYRPICDINEDVSCSKALGSAEGMLFGFPNPVLGLVFYPVLYVLYVVNVVFALGLVMVSLPFIAYLGYQLYVLKTWCLVCITSYVITVSLLFFILNILV